MKNYENKLNEISFRSSRSGKLFEKFRTNRFTHMTNVFGTERRNEQLTVFP